MTWQYLVRVVNSVSVNLQVELDALGLEGWELVDIFRDGPMLKLICKRFKPEEKV